MTWFRNWLGLIIIAVSLVALVVVSWVAIGTATDQSRAEMTRLVFASVVPLVGTWVGTVLAFYFGRENYEAAQRASRETYEAAKSGVSSATPVAEVMRPAAQVAALPPVPDDAAARALPLADIFKFMEDRNVSRVPVLTAAGVILYVIHDAKLDSFAMNAGVAKPDFGGRTLDAFLNDSVASASATAFTTVVKSATVRDARAALRATKDCKDVFVTEGGSRGDKVVGWMTDTDLARTMEV